MLTPREKSLLLNGSEQGQTCDAALHMMIIIIIIIIIIIAFKGAIWDFLQSPHSAMNCLQHARSSGLGAIVCKSRATHPALVTRKCHVKFDRVEIAFIWALFYWLNHLTDEGGEETGVPRENPWRRASENATYYSPKIQAPSETRTHAVALLAGSESRHANRYTTHRPKVIASLTHYWLSYSSPQLVDWAENRISD